MVLRFQINTKEPRNWIISLNSVATFLVRVLETNLKIFLNVFQMELSKGLVKWYNFYKNLSSSNTNPVLSQCKHFMWKGLR